MDAIMSSSAIKIHHLDIRGAIVPITHLKIIRAFREIKPDEILEITGNDPDTRKDIFKVLSAFHYRLMSVDEDENFYKIKLKKE